MGDSIEIEMMSDFKILGNGLGEGLEEGGVRVGNLREGEE